MRICILAFDGLEHSFVARWRLKHLLQEHHGIYSSVIDPRYGKPHTPTCWASFITGKPVEEHGVSTWWGWNGFLEKLRFLPPFIWIKGKRKFLEKLGIKPKLRTIPRNLNTIFDVVKPSIALFIPSYNEPAEFRSMYGDAMKKSLSEFMRCVWEVHELRKREFFRYLGCDDWKLLMCWFDLADLMSHAYTPSTKHLLLKAYFELNNIAMKVRRMVGEGAAVLIVSDHGMRRTPDGSLDHSDHGFWSLNIKPPYEPKKTTDFYKLILDLANL